MRAKNFITEVNRLTANDYPGGAESIRHSAFPKNLKPLPGGSGFLYGLYTAYGNATIMIIDPNGEIGQWPNKTTGKVIVAKLETYRQKHTAIPNCYGVNTITVHEAYRGKGLAKALYGIVLHELGYNLISGDSQTPGGRQNWLSLSKIPGCEVVGLLKVNSEYFEKKKSKWDDEDTIRYRENKAGSLVDSLMTAGCVYQGDSRSIWCKYHWFIFPITVNKKELAAKIKSDIKLYTNYDNTSDWETYLLARWIA